MVDRVSVKIRLASEASSMEGQVGAGMTWDQALQG